MVGQLICQMQAVSMLESSREQLSILGQSQFSLMLIDVDFLPCFNLNPFIRVHVAISENKISLQKYPHL